MRTLFVVSFCLQLLIASAQNEYFMNSPKWGMIDETQWAQFGPVFGTKTTYFVNGDTLLNGVLFVKIFEEGISGAKRNLFISLCVLTIITSRSIIGSTGEGIFLMFSLLLYISLGFYLLLLKIDTGESNANGS